MKLFERIVSGNAVFAGKCSAAIVGLTLAAASIAPLTSQAFTQSGVGTDIANGIPMGHEWITRMAVLELIGGDPILKPDPKDPRRNWTKGLAKNLSLSTPGAQAEVARIKSMPIPSVDDIRYKATFRFIFHTIVGERWVDTGGFNVTKGKLTGVDCFDAVAQEPVDVQYDHFMRRYDDRNGDGGVNAAKKSQERFIEYFVAAAIAPPTVMQAWDGGGFSVLENVDRNYFLFGRALHLFEDSFSSEHAVRIAADNYEQVRQVKSYLCAAGSEQHTHSLGKVFDYSSGDVIWLPGTGIDNSWAAYKPSNMKDVALVATEATKDLWAAFIRTMGAPPQTRAQVARNEATTLVNNWLRIDETQARTWYDDPARRDATYVLAQGQGGKGNSVADCMRGLGEASGDQMKKVREMEATQRLCLYNIRPVEGYADLFDTSMKLHFNWEWKSDAWLQPPSAWSIPTQPADTGKRVRIRAAANNQYLTAPDGLAADNWVYARGNNPALDFILVGDMKNGYLRLTYAPSLFLSYRESTGAVKLYGSAFQANYLFQSVPNYNNAYSIKSNVWNMYMWLSGESPYITRTGDPKQRNAMWTFEGL